MTLTDIRRNILESVDAEWFNGAEATFNFNYINFSISLKGVSSIFEFVNKQIEGWEKLGENIPDELINSKKYFEQIKTQIEHLVNVIGKTTRAQLERKWNEITQKIKTTSQFPLKYNCPEVEFLLKVYSDHPQSFKAAFQFITNGNTVSVNNKPNIIGTILAYEFTLKEASKITKRIESEKAQLITTKREFETSIAEAESHLSEYLRLTNEKYIEYTRKIESLKKEKNNEFETWFEDTKSNFAKFGTETKMTVKALETSYEELLRLKKPADYWKSRSIELKNEGWQSLTWLIIIVIFTSIILYSLLWLTPEGMLESFFNKDKTVALRWTIVFITLISFLAYGIKALTKITFSSFHLARDAEERERLTYVYLAMLKDSSVEKEDRHLIMQSLFSRADTGLLKDDSSPTMPGTSTIIDKVTRQ